MRSFFHKIWSIALFGCVVAVAQPALALTPPTELVSQLQGKDATKAEFARAQLMTMNDPAVLPLLLAHIDGIVDMDGLVRTLQVMTPICDATCVPALAAALRADRQEIVLEACRAAGKLGRPELRPPLLALVAHHPSREVRYEAARALDAVTDPSGYDSLFGMVQFREPDAAMLHIIRELPIQSAERYVDRFSELALDPVASSSAVSAYILVGQPELLFNRILHTSLADLPRKSRAQALVALKRLATHCDSQKIDDVAFHKLTDFALTTTDLEEVQSVARILAPFDDAFMLILRLSNIRMDAFSPETVAPILDALSPKSAQTLIDLVLLDDGLTNEPFGKKALVDYTYPTPATYSFYKLLALYPTPEASHLAVDAMNSQDLTLQKIAVHVLASSESSEASQKLLTLLGHHSLGESAAHALVNHLDAQLDITRAKDDAVGTQYYIRWIKAAQAMKTGHVSQPELDEARGILATPRRRHAVPALALLIAAESAPPSIDPVASRQLAFETQRLWFKARCVSKSATDNDIVEALENPVTVAEALSCLISDPKRAEKILDYNFEPDEDDEDEKVENESIYLPSLILSRDKQVALRAMIIAQKLSENQVELGDDVLMALNSRLFDDDERLPHNALLALRAMRALPARDTLIAIYARAKSSRAKTLIALLADIPHAAELEESTSIPTEFVLSEPRDFTIYNGAAFDSVDLSNIAARFGF